MKKVTIVLAIILVLVLVIAGCSKTTTTPAQTTTTRPLTTTTTSAPPVTTFAPINLKLESFTPKGTPPNVTFRYIFDGLAAATNNQITTEYLEAGVMGAPTETLGRVQQGVVDVGVLVASYYTSVFPMTEIFELPIHYPTSTAAAKAIIDLKKKGYFDKEYSQFKLITMYSLGPYNLMSTKPVRKVEDLKGMKLRGPGDMYRRITEAVGGVPITMAGAEIFNALDKGIIDATWGNWEQSFAFKLQEATDYTVTTQTSTSIHLLVMNLNTWNRLPQVAKDWLDNNFEAGLMKAAETWDTTNEKYFQVLKDDSRIEKIVWNDAEFAKFDSVLAPIFDNWKKEREAQGHKAGQALTDLYNNLKAQGIERPFAQVQ